MFDTNWQNFSCDWQLFNSYFSFSYDLLILRDGVDSSVLAILTGSNMPENNPINSTGNSVYIELVTDDANAQNGFRFEYKACKPNEISY